VSWLRRLIDCESEENYFKVRNFVLPIAFASLSLLASIFQPNLLLPSVIDEPYLVDASSNEAALILKQEVQQVPYTGVLIESDFSTPVPPEVQNVVDLVVEYLVYHPMAIKPSKCTSLDSLLAEFLEQTGASPPVIALKTLALTDRFSYKKCFSMINEVCAYHGYLLFATNCFIQLAYTLITTPKVTMLKLTPSATNLIQLRIQKLTKTCRTIPGIVYNPNSKKKVADKVTLKDLFKKSILTADNPLYAKNGYQIDHRI